MNLILFSGTHPRHLFVNRELLKHFEEVLVVVMQREELVPTPPDDLCKHDRALFIHHFEAREAVEDFFYGNLTAEEVFNNVEVFFVSPEQLNTAKVCSKVKSFDADFCFIFGVNMILEPVINALPRHKINLHLGLSPWFKGDATLYWPFYHLIPQYCGITFHQITEKADAGEIIHQCVPTLSTGQTLHEVAADCVILAKNEVNRLIDYWAINRDFKGFEQKTHGRVWLSSDFHPSQLRIIYDAFEDKIVDRYLSGELSQKKPKLYSCLD